MEDDGYLDYLDKTLEQRRNFRAVSLDQRFLMIRCVACFNGLIPVDHATANSSARLPCLQRSLGSDN